MRRSLISAGLVAAVLSGAAPAGAFCRTTTEKIPAGYDPTVSGCVTEGTVLAWPSMPVTYEIHQSASTQVSLAQATALFGAAFSAWTQASCSTVDPTQHPALSFEVLPPSDATFVPCSTQACEQAQSVGPHQIIFRDEGWEYDDPANELALTTVTFAVDSGDILSANMEINSSNHVLSIVDPPPAGAYSLQMIAKHEAGHFVGLAHSQHTSAVMYAYYQPAEIALTPDDVEGICTIYPPAGPSSGCACAMGGRSDGAIAFGVTAIAIAACFQRRRRR
jgi:Matrixin